ncbi:hypothetical protein T4D_1591 [Trichinella pseudospiralis]|uniref:Uncharacterized protein n=1 Tax=Trichinella pseudospiralis TaxID=6337 RepID=A0A0V1FIM3_TRIPS|nr:hypothetical protein T4D_1591 [Trichinella pseudospiralis]
MASVSGDGVIFSIMRNTNVSQCYWQYNCIMGYFTAYIGYVKPYIRENVAKLVRSKVQAQSTKASGNAPGIALGHKKFTYANIYIA